MFRLAVIYNNADHFWQKKVIAHQHENLKLVFNIVFCTQYIVYLRKLSITSSNELSSDKSFSDVQDEISNVSLSEPLSSELLLYTHFGFKQWFNKCYLKI
jgi:hypothetical protein